MARRTLIAGCGYVGSALAEALAQQGELVFGLRRSQQPLPRGVSHVVADLAEPTSLSVIPEAIDTVVYAASADQRSEEAYRRAYVAGPENLLAFLDDRGDPVRRVVYVSSTGVYGYADGRWIDEDTPTNSSGTGAILEEGEGRCLAGPFPSVILRLGGIYGPGRRNLIDRVLAREATCASGPPRYSNRMHLHDIVAAIVHLLDLERARDVYLGVDDDPADSCTVARWLASQLGVPPPATVDRPAPRTNKRCRNKRLVESGLKLRYPTFREGYAQVLKQLGLLSGSSEAAP